MVRERGCQAEHWSLEDIDQAEKDQAEEMGREGDCQAEHWSLVDNRGCSSSSSLTNTQPIRQPLTITRAVARYVDIPANNNDDHILNNIITGPETIDQAEQLDEKEYQEGCQAGQAEQQEQMRGVAGRAEQAGQTEVTKKGAEARDQAEQPGENGEMGLEEGCRAEHWSLVDEIRVCSSSSRSSNTQPIRQPLTIPRAVARYVEIQNKTNDGQILNTTISGPDNPDQAEYAKKGAMRVKMIHT